MRDARTNHFCSRKGLVCSFSLTPEHLTCLHVTCAQTHFDKMHLLHIIFGVVYTVCAMWFLYQLKAYLMCVKTVEEASAKNMQDFWQQRIRANFHILGEDLKTTCNPLESLIVLSLYYNTETIYKTIRLAEQLLLTSEFMHPECTSSVAMTFVPFNYPYYDDVRILWLSAVNQVQLLRKELESKRFEQDGHILYEEDFNILASTYARVLNEFESLKNTINQLSATETDFQIALRTFPYSLLAKVILRLKLNFLSDIEDEIKQCDDDLKKYPVYIVKLRTLSKEETQLLQEQQVQQVQQQLQQEQTNVNIALHAQ